MEKPDYQRAIESTKKRIDKLNKRISKLQDVKRKF